MQRAGGRHLGTPIHTATTVPPAVPSERMMRRGCNLAEDIIINEEQGPPDQRPETTTSRE